MGTPSAACSAPLQQDRAVLTELVLAKAELRLRFTAIFGRPEQDLSSCRPVSQGHGYYSISASDTQRVTMRLSSRAVLSVRSLENMHFSPCSLQISLWTLAKSCSILKSKIMLWQMVSAPIYLTVTVNSRHCILSGGLQKKGGNRVRTLNYV